MAIKKHYANITLKKKWREKIYNFILKSFNKNQLKDLKVLCLPGHEMTEIFEIYDRLGIKRKNIIGLEGNPETFKELRKTNNSLKEKIIIKNISLGQYLSKNKNKNCFDLINLDFTAYFDNDKNIIIKKLIKNSFVTKRTVLVTNYPVGSSLSVIDKNRELSKSCTNIKSLFSPSIKSHYKNKRKLSNCNKIISERIQLAPINHFLGGGGFSRSTIFKKWATYQLKNIEEPSKFAKLIKMSKKGETHSVEIINSLFFSKDNLSPQNLSLLLIFFQLENHFLEKHESFIYKSSKNTTMLSDFYLFVQYDYSKIVNLVIDKIDFEYMKGNLKLLLNEESLEKDSNLKFLLGQYKKQIKNIIDKVPKKRKNIF